jgi:DNA-directed RNA polymerase subunit K/omega
MKGSSTMIYIDANNSFEFVILASLRVRQLIDGCTPRVEGDGKHTAIAQREIRAGKITKVDPSIRV